MKKYARQRNRGNLKKKNLRSTKRLPKAGYLDTNN